MAVISRFEEFDCWQKARVLCQQVYEITTKESFSKDFALKDQILKASGSVMDNIAEGFERGGNKEFIQFLFISKASCAEVKSQLYRALDRKHINEKQFNKIYLLACEVSKLLQGLISYLSESDKQGYKLRTKN